MIMAHNILIVDDSSVTRAVLKKTIAMAQVPVDQVYQAADGQQALDLLKEHQVDVVLADLNMPGMNGWEMTEKILADETTRDIAIVIISTEASQTRIDELGTQGIKGYIHKPFTPEQVREELCRVLELCPS